LISILGQPQTLDFIKQIRSKETYYPFFAHADMQMVPDSEETMFRTRLLKLANGLVVITNDNGEKGFQVKS